MMRLYDSSLLAYTKLRTRKVRLTVTIIISGLLLTVLTTGSFVMRGAFKSVESFSKDGLGSRFLIQGNMLDTGPKFELPELIIRAEQLHKENILLKKAEAKKLRLEYDEKSEQSPVIEFDGNNGKTKQIDPSSTIGAKVYAEYLNKQPTVGLPEFKKQSEPFGAINYFQTWPIAMGGQTSPTLTVLKDGVEKYEPQNGNPQPFNKGLDGFVSSWALASSDLLKLYTLPGATLAKIDENIPIVVPYSAVEELAGFKPLPGNAKPSEKLERIKLVREKAGDIKFQVCYRNSQSNNELQETISQIQQLEQNKTNKDYVKPSLIYDLPKSPCTQSTITKDVRTSFEKTQTANQLIFDRQFGKQIPDNQIVKFRVVGISPDPPDFAAASVDQLIYGLLGSFLGSSWFTPIELHQNSEFLQKIFVENSSSYGNSSRSYIVEFPSANQARDYNIKIQCNPDYSVIFSDTAADPSAECIKSGKNFYLSPFGSSSLALDSAKEGFGKFFRIATLVVAGIASLIMIGTIGRIIADSRRETAVFRAIGAKRLDIAQIYLTYTFYLTVLISIFAILSGFILSNIADAKWGDQLTIASLLVYNSQDLTQRFSLFAIHIKDLLYLVGLVVAAGLVSSILPLLSNLRRNPIRDMRDEN